MFVHRFCQDNEVADEHFDPHQVTGPMFLHEVGGNIGEEESWPFFHIFSKP